MGSKPSIAVVSKSVYMIGSMAINGDQEPLGMFWMSNDAISFIGFAVETNGVIRHPEHPQRLLMSNDAISFIGFAVVHGIMCVGCTVHNIFRRFSISVVASVTRTLFLLVGVCAV